jgi:hypothetical protein
MWLTKIKQANILRPKIGSRKGTAIDYGLTGVVLDEEVDLKNYTVWVCEIVHGYSPWTPLYTFTFCELTSYGMQYAAELLRKGDQL